MDISNRKSLLMAIHKTADEDTLRSIVHPGQHTNEELLQKLKDLEQGLASAGPTGPMSYTKEQREKLLAYKALDECFKDKYCGGYIYRPLQEFGEKLSREYLVPAIDGLGKMVSGAKAEGIPLPATPDRAEAIKEIKRSDASGYDFKYFEKISSALNNDDFHKLASPNIILADINSAFEKEFNKSFDIFHQKFAEEYNDTSFNADIYNKFYELAVAHHILTQEGLLKEAKIIDDFVTNNTALFGFVKNAWSIRDAWQGVKNTVSKGVEYAGRAVKAVGKAIVKGFKSIKYLLKGLPYIGIIFSTPFAIKNCIEAYQNSKRIMEELDLPKFGFNRSRSILPEHIKHVRSTFIKAVDNFKEDPESLKELLIIYRTIGVFYVDVLFAITNTFMALLDVIAIFGAIAGFFSFGLGWLVSVGALGGSWLLAIGIAGIELSAEYFQNHYWEKDQLYMQEVAMKEVMKIQASGTPIENQGGDIIIEEDYDEEGALNMNVSPDVIETAEKSNVPQQHIYDPNFAQFRPAATA